MQSICQYECDNRVTRLEERHNHVLEKLDIVVKTLETTNQNIERIRLESAENKGARKATIALITAIASGGAWLISTATDSLSRTFHH